MKNMIVGSLLLIFSFSLQAEVSREDLPTYAERGNAIAQFYIAHGFYGGYGVGWFDSSEESIAKAVPLLKKSASQGFAPAYALLGEIYSEEKEYNKAFQFYTKAFDHGDVSAAIGLSFLYFNGKGVIQDPQQSYVWTLVAIATTGDGYNKYLVKRRDELESKLGKSEVISSRKEAKKKFSEVNNARVQLKTKFKTQEIELGIIST